MNIKTIQQLIDLLKEADLESISYKDKNFEVELKRASQISYIESHPRPQIQEKEVSLNKQESQGEVIKSILVGVYYGRPSPDKEPFVKVGDKVNQGDVLCIIEAMKVMNEIKANRSGVIEAIHVQEGDMVDFDQPLFTIL